MYSLRPHKRFNFVGMWKYGFILSGILIALSIAGFIVSTVVTGAPLTLGTEFSGGTSIQITSAENLSEDQLKDAFASAANELGYSTQISSIQTSTTATGASGYIVKTTDTVSTNASDIMANVEKQLGIDSANVQIETIGASWGASVIWSSILAFIMSWIGILFVIAIRYREPRMGVVALICLFHDMIIVLGIYAWAGMFMHMEITSDVIAALLAIIGYSLYDTVVVFHRINRNASPQMKCSLRTCANRSLNEVIVRSINTSITSVIPVLFMLLLGTDTLLDFAFAMVCGMIIGVYSTLAISAPIYTTWKARDAAYARLEKKYPYVVEQSIFTKEMLLQARKDKKASRAAAKEEARLEEERARKEKAESKKLESKADESDSKPKPEPEIEPETELESEIEVELDSQVETDTAEKADSGFDDESLSDDAFEPEERQ